jgi:chromosomal replication initiator protein
VLKETPDQTENAAVKDASPMPKRPFRLAKGRPSAAQREKRIAEAAAAAAMNSMMPLAPHANAHLSGQNQHQEMNSTRLSEEQPPEPQKYASVISSAPAPQKYASIISSGPAPLPGEGLLNARYTFSTFIVGKSNQFAHAASFAVAENPGHIYNPLFLYGGVGLGKTHLLHAVGHVGEAAGLNVLYVTSERFTNEIINAIRFQKTEEFRAKYRQIDILLVDDIQFIAGKESTEEEFFHTFNSLHNASKQIVVTSDRPPKAIHSLQDRLRSRFEWGLLADVQPPEYEHRLAILRSKSESLHFVVPASVIEYIARPECSSVRELEGALNRVLAYATLHDAPITVGLAAQALENIYNEKKPVSTLTVAEVLEGVCRYYNVSATLIRGKQRDREIVWPRQVAMYLMREETNASLLQIGTALGGRDHTTIMHGWEKVHTEINNNDLVRQEIAAVLASFQHGQV